MAAEGESSGRARGGVEHFQAAAKELIAAGRALLDATEELIDDPRAIEQLVAEAGALMHLAGGAFVRAMAAATGSRDESAAEDQPQRVQRIRVS